jgi:hypothetical protein
MDSKEEKRRTMGVVYFHNAVSTAISVYPERVEGISIYDIMLDEYQRMREDSYPSLISSDNSARYGFHLSPMTFPQEKQRTGSGIYREIDVSLCYFCGERSLAMADKSYQAAHVLLNASISIFVSDAFN